MQAHMNLVVAAALGAIGGCLDPREVTSLETAVCTQEPVTTEIEVAGRHQLASVAFSQLRPAYLSTDVNQYYDFGAEYDADDPTSLVVYNGPPYSTAHSLGEPRQTEMFIFSASFEIVAVQARTKDHYYVVGRLGSEDIVERWKRAPVLNQGSGSSAYVMKRTQLYRGNLGRVWSIGVDHLTRFLFLLHGDGPTRLSKMSLPGGGTPVQIFASTQIPALATARDNLFPRRHAAFGVVWTLGSRTPVGGVQDFVLLFDDEDDGVVNAYDVLGYSQYSSLYATASSDWTDLFLFD